MKNSGKMLNAEIVRSGYASVMIIPPNVKYKDRFLDALREGYGNNDGF